MSLSASEQQTLDSIGASSDPKLASLLAILPGSSQARPGYVACWN